MYARLNTLTGVKDIEASVKYLEEVSLSVVRAQKGYKGLSAAANRSEGILAILSLWETAADREASESALAKVREEARSQLATGLTVETFDQRTHLVNSPPTVGNSVMLTRVSMDPGRIDEIIGYTEQHILPKISDMPGFRSIRTLVNPDTGEGVVGSVWDDEQTLQAAAEAALALRPDIISRGMTFGDRTYGEVVFTDLR